MHGLLLNPLLLLLLLCTFLTTRTSWGWGGSAQTRQSSSQIKEEEEAIQRAAFLTFRKHYKTGHIYNISIPPPSSSPSSSSSSSSSNFTTLSLTQAVRLRYGSLRRRGLALNQFHIQPGSSILTPPPPPPPAASLLKHQHLLLVYQNLPNSSLYPIQDGYVLASSVLTLYAYNASNMTPVYTLPQLLLTTRITVTLIPLYNTSTNYTSTCSSSSTSSFTSSSSSSFASSSSSLLCATFSNGNLSLSLAHSYPSSNQELTCSWSELGAFYLLSKKGKEVVGENSISPSCKTAQGESINGKKRVYWWKIAVGSVMGASLSIFSLSFLLLVSISRRRKERRHVLMEKVAEEGESLHMALIQNTRAPSAFGTRTKPRLETDYSS